MSEVAGTNTLELAIAQANPEPPDVAVAGETPGGVLVPLTPSQAFGAVATVRRNQYLLAFEVAQGQAVTVRRIYVSLPVILAELGVESSSSTVENHWTFQTAEEEKEWIEGKGGFPKKTTTVTPISPETRYQKTTAETTRGIREGAFEETKTTVDRSTLPITASVEITLNGRGGPLWAESFDIDLRLVGGEKAGAGPGEYLGGGLIGAYADLVNPITLTPDQDEYGLGIAVFIPTSHLTACEVGREAKAWEANTAGDGVIKIFSDLENVPLGK